MRRKFLCLAVAVGLASVPAVAADFSFTGTLDYPDDIRPFDFTVAAPSLVTLRTWSFAGGTNAAGASISGGGFDPQIALFAMPGGAFLAMDDDGSPVVNGDGRSYDSLWTGALAAGRYRVALYAYPNGPIGNYYDGPEYSGPGGAFQGENRWALDIVNVDSARLYVPESSSWLLLVAGFGLTGAAMRRRRSPGLQD